MTKYILHGGTRMAEGVYLRDEKFLDEMLQVNTQTAINILLCYFAKSAERWPALLEEDERDFKRVAKGQEIIFHVADERRFAEQIKGSDVIYIRGGDAKLLKEKLLATSDLKNLLNGKIVGACSAGANILSKYYWDTDYHEIEEGLAALDIKTICHYDDDLKPMAEKLKWHGSTELPLILLEEDSYKIVEK